MNFKFLKYGLLSSTLISMGSFAQTAADMKAKFATEMNNKAPEDSILRYAYGYYNLVAAQNPNVLDSINGAVAKLYPTGSAAALLEIMTAQKTLKSGGSITAAQYEAMPAKYTSADFKNPNTSVGYYYKNLFAEAFASMYKSDPNKSLEMASAQSAQTLNAIAWGFAEKGQDLDNAARLSKLSLDKSKADLADSASIPAEYRSQWRESVINSAGLFEDTYATILSKQGKTSEAIPYEADAYSKTKGEEDAVNATYLRLLNDDNQHAKALELAKTMYVSQASNDEVKAQLTKAFLATNKGGDTTALFAKLDANKADAKLAKLKSEVLNTPSHDFTLKDLSGKTVSLADYKGKIVILDFWATWCGPCKMSFPGMQLAVNKYKADKDVVFLFIDTWEHTKPEATKKAVTSFIDDHKYTFHVLLDEPEANSKQFKAIAPYGVDGIPTKFIIGKDGLVKFKIVGYSGSDQSVLEEVSNAVNFLKG